MSNLNRERKGRSTAHFAIRPETFDFSHGDRIVRETADEMNRLRIMSRNILTETIQNLRNL